MQLIHALYTSDSLVSEYDVRSSIITSVMRSFIYNCGKSQMFERRSNDLLPASCNSSRSDTDLRTLIWIRCVERRRIGLGLAEGGCPFALQRRQKFRHMRHLKSKDSMPEKLVSIYICFICVSIYHSKFFLNYYFKKKSDIWIIIHVTENNLKFYKQIFFWKIILQNIRY